MPVGFIFKNLERGNEIAPYNINSELHSRMSRIEIVGDILVILLNIFAKKSEQEELFHIERLHPNFFINVNVIKSRSKSKQANGKLH